MLCVELVVSQIGGWERVGWLGLPAGGKVSQGLAPGATQTLGSMCLCSYLKLSFLSRKQMFLLSFSNFSGFFLG